jgi:hypothetical protein
MVRSHDGSSEKNANGSYRLTVFTMVGGGRVLPWLLAHVGGWSRASCSRLLTIALGIARCGPRTGLRSFIVSATDLPGVQESFRTAYHLSLVPVLRSAAS